MPKKSQINEYSDVISFDVEHQIRFKKVSSARLCNMCVISLGSVHTIGACNLEAVNSGKHEERNVTCIFMNTSHAFVNVELGFHIIRSQDSDFLEYKDFFEI